MTTWDGALCAQIGGDLWFADRGDHVTVAAAKRICSMCPLRVTCLEYALDAENTGDNLEGVWGGLSPRERSKLRPRKVNGSNWRHRKPCGTNAAHRRHLRNGEKPCQPCIDAATRDRAARKQAAA